MFIPAERPEVASRIAKLYGELCKNAEGWDAALIAGRVNQFYYTGTMQDGIFVIRRDGAFGYYVYKSYERAKTEGLIDEIYPMSSYRELAGMLGDGTRKVCIEGDVMTYALLERLRGYLKFTDTVAIDALIMRQRSVKSGYEIECMRESGRQHRRICEDVIPTLMREGISEAELGMEIYCEMMKAGYQGISRFSRFQSELVVGQMGFGENSLYPTSFNGPGGMRGLSPAVPMLGSRERLLKRGDLVFIDFAFGVNGYSTDRTQIYSFGSEPSKEAADAHEECLKIQKATGALLKAGNIPSAIYDEMTAGGFENLNSKFLGHGVGLHVDEYPVIARGFDEPLVAGMTIAVEPKIAVPGQGLAGNEDTYLVTAEGGECLTLGEKDIIVV